MAALLQLDQEIWCVLRSWKRWVSQNSAGTVAGERCSDPSSDSLSCLCPGLVQAISFHSSFLNLLKGLLYHQPGAQWPNEFATWNVTRWSQVGELVLANLVAFPAFYLSTQALWKVESLEEATCVQHKIDEVLNLDVGYKKAGSNFVVVVACWFRGFLSSGRTLEQRKWSLPQQNTPWMSELAAGKILARFWWASPWWRFVHVFAWCKLECLGVWFAVDGCWWVWKSTNFQCRYKAAKTEITYDSRIMLI